MDLTHTQAKSSTSFAGGKGCNVNSVNSVWSHMTYEFPERSG